MTLPLNQLVTFNPISVTAQTPLDQVVDMLHIHGMHHWPVVNDDREVIAMISETDIVRSAHLNMLAEATTAGRGADTGDEAAAWRPTTVGDIMSHAVVAVELDAPARTALKLLLDHRFHALPVLQDGRLTAMITTGDFLREFSYGEMAASRQPVSKYAIPFEDTVEATATLDEALLAMFETGHKFVAVLRGGCPIGVVSHRDLAKARCRQEAAELAGGGGGNINLLRLTTDGVTFKPGAKMAEAAATFAERGCEGALVVNQANRMVGMLTVQEVLQAMLPGI